MGRGRRGRGGRSRALIPLPVYRDGRLWHAQANSSESLQWDLSPLEMALEDPDLRNVEPHTGPGEARRPPSPPPSIHSSVEDGLDEGNRKNRREYTKLRNENVMDYLMGKGKSKPHVELPRTGSSSSRPSGQLVEKEVCLSGTSNESNQSFVGSNARHFYQMQNKFFHDVDAQRREMQMKHEAELGGEGEVIFSHMIYHQIIQAKWMIVQLKRMETLLENSGDDNFFIPPKWLEIEIELEHMYGPMDKSSEMFRGMVEELKVQRWEDIMEMFDNESRVKSEMAARQFSILERSANIEYLKEYRFQIEQAISALSEGKLDMNPFTSPEQMDFWVMPRPHHSISAYALRAEETDKLVESNIVVKNNLATHANVEKVPLAIIKGYNAAAFSVGWNFYPYQVTPDISRRSFYPGPGYLEYLKCGKLHEYVHWSKHLLRLREFLAGYRSLGVELDYFLSEFRNKYEISDLLFGGMRNEDAVHQLSDLFLCQKLEDGRIILFDGILEGQIVTPKQLLLNIWKRIRFLIDLQPGQKLVIDRIPKVFEFCFKQPFFVQNWGFASTSQFVTYTRKLFPGDQATTSTFITRKGELSVSLEIARKKAGDHDLWADILMTDDDDEEDDDEDIASYFCL